MHVPKQAFLTRRHVDDRSWEGLLDPWAFDEHGLSLAVARDQRVGFFSVVACRAL